MSQSDLHTPPVAAAAADTPREGDAASDTSPSSELVAPTLAATSAAFPVTRAALDASEVAHAELDRGIAASRSQLQSVDDKMAMCAETFSRLPAYTDKLKSMSANMKILRENVSKLRTLAVDIGKDAKEYCAAAQVEAPELEAAL